MGPRDPWDINVLVGTTMSAPFARDAPEGGPGAPRRERCCGGVQLRGEAGVIDPGWGQDPANDSCAARRAVATAVRSAKKKLDKHHS